MYSVHAQHPTLLLHVLIIISIFLLPKSTLVVKIKVGSPGRELELKLKGYIVALIMTRGTRSGTFIKAEQQAKDEAKRTRRQSFEKSIFVVVSGKFWVYLIVSSRDPIIMP